ncbi:MAG: PqqD family protein [Pyrinomonadaceae bacterium]
MKADSRQTRPLARKEGLVIEELSDEVLIYDLERDRAHCLNQTAAFVWQRCNGRKSARDITRELSSTVGERLDDKIVWLALHQLKRNHLLIDAPIPPAKVVGMDRREMVRALGLTAAVAIPVVASIVAPTPAEAATGCASAGQPCGGSNPACCSGCACNSGTCVGSC